jgi:hypothetical protein
VPSNDGDRAIRESCPPKAGEPLCPDIQKPTTNNQQRLRQEPGLPNMVPPVGRGPVPRRLDDSNGSRRGVNPRPTEDSATINGGCSSGSADGSADSSVGYGLPATGSSPCRKRRRSLYTLGCGHRSAPRTPT